MAVSGKTAAPWEVPYLLESDFADMGAGDKAIAERLHAILAAENQQSLTWLKKGTEKQLIVCNASGVPQYVTASGDVTNTNAGVFTIGTGKVTQAKLAAEAVNSSKVEVGSLTDADLASPNNAVYRVLTSAFGMLRNEVAAATYFLSGERALASGTSNSNVQGPIFYFAKADYEVASKTQKLRLRASIATNATKPTLKFTVGLYPVTVTGGSLEMAVTLGSVVAGSTVEFNEPAASAVIPAVGSDFSIPSDGAYVLGVATSAKQTANSMVFLNAQLQSRSV